MSGTLNLQAGQMVGETPKRFVPFLEADRSRTDSGPRTMESIAAGHGVITHMGMLVVA